ncbi:hypothetical protein [Sinorhizobium sp. RAC02]|uniref:hypothetical protein n=1 Tax=Sinorhizobium sp. RAC02 TaxID=1842534 RepID=UPI00083D8D72|nr:hypothetical protein [Sinorhizobium sp. RAC02]AOF90211.1 hypothetical protein BSY16_2293 [Sinorhizobium sp. RAC02]
MAAANLRVRNWEQFQHYKDRNPPWIKLHFALLASEDWVTLDDASKLLAIVCMLIASRNNGEVPNNPAYLKRVAYLDKVPKLEPLISCGFLENLQAPASTMQAPASAAQADARPETETDTDTDNKKDIPSSRGKRAMVDEEIRTEFEKQFWPVYPRKVDKQDALKAFAKARSLTPLEIILDALKSYSREVEGKEPQFVRHAARWLNAQPWDDAAAPSQPPVPIDDDRWLKRIDYARQKNEWPTAWGPRPGDAGCAAPAHLLEPTDGANWIEMEIAR